MIKCIVGVVSNIVSAARVILVWRLCYSRLVWATGMKNHYLKNKHISLASATLFDSGTWKWIVASKHIALQCIQKTGRDTSVWYDSWLPNGRFD